MSLIDNWERITPAQQENAILNGVKDRDKKKGKRGKKTEDLTATALEMVKGVAQWNSNTPHPMCDKVVNWRGLFVLVECKETHKPHFEFHEISDKEHGYLREVSNKHGLALIVIRWVVTFNSARGFVITYPEFMALQKHQKFKYFDLSDPGLAHYFRPFSFTVDRLASDRGERTQFEDHVSMLLRKKSRPLP
ncbi:MAG: hypothetical protein E6R03_06220 [Hyphomicrobiaceae bacterium]|nr:MAG: hypothetical protein E6R03_06220 [Hyphomicrobiaceae bacterium]